MWPGMMPSLFSLFQSKQAMGNVKGSGTKAPNTGGGNVQGGSGGVQGMAPLKGLSQEDLQAWPGYDASATSGENMNAYGNAFQAQTQQPQTSTTPPVNPIVKQAVTQGPPAPSPSPAQQVQGPPSPSGPSIWDKLSGGLGKVAGGIKEWDQAYTKRVQDRGYMEKPESSEPESPWDIKSIEDDQWWNRKDAVLVDPKDPEKNSKMLDLARDEDGNVDPMRYKQVQQYVSDEGNPVVEQGIKDQRTEMRQQYDDSLFGKANRWINPVSNQIMRWASPYAQQLWGDISGNTSPVTKRGN